MGVHIIAGTSLYVKYPDCRLFSAPKVGAGVLAVLNRKAVVVWTGNSSRDGDRITFLEVRFGKRTGWVNKAVLTPDPDSLDGSIPAETDVCTACDGTGHAATPALVRGWGNVGLAPPCPVCHGTGHVALRAFGPAIQSMSGGTRG